MPVDKWEIYGADYDYLQEKRALEIVKTMIKTAYAHVRDFPPGKEKKVGEKVNQKANGENWIKVRVGKLTGTKKEVVIFYHKLKHADQLTPPQSNAWSISVGAHPEFMPEKRISKTDPDVSSEPYVQLASKLLNKMWSDATSGILGTDPVLVVYDWVNPPGAEPPDTGILDPVDRRTSPIGELGWVGEQLLKNDVNWKVVEPTHMVKRPTWINPDTMVEELIPGWGRDDPDDPDNSDKYCIRTALKPVP